MVSRTSARASRAERMEGSRMFSKPPTNDFPKKRKLTSPGKASSWAESQPFLGSGEEGPFWPQPDNSHGPAALVEFFYFLSAPHNTKVDKLSGHAGLLLKPMAHLPLPAPSPWLCAHRPLTLPASRPRLRLQASLSALPPWTAPPCPICPVSSAQLLPAPRCLCL